MLLCEAAANEHDAKIREFTTNIDVPPGLFSARIDLARKAAASVYRQLVQEGLDLKEKERQKKETQARKERQAVEDAAKLDPHQ
eukprot:8175850-Alexandrium_andersonii.AAC.1